MSYSVPDEWFNDDWGSFIRVWRTAHGWSAKELGEKTEIDPGALSKKERGVQDWISTKELWALLQLMNIQERKIFLDVFDFESAKDPEFCKEMLRGRIFHEDLED